MRSIMDFEKILKAVVVLIVGIACDGFVLTFGMDSEIPAWVLYLLLVVFTGGSVVGAVYILKKN